MKNRMQRYVQLFRDSEVSKDNQSKVGASKYTGFHSESPRYGNRYSQGSESPNQPLQCFLEYRVQCHVALGTFQVEFISVILLAS